MTASRYIIGIDLGTSNCAMSYMDTLLPNPRTEIFQPRQWINETAIQSRDKLPSLIYIHTPSERKRSTFKRDEFEGSCEWTAGELARSRLREQPGRVVHSAKSWLCHRAMNRKEAFLPWESNEVVGVDKISPVEASSKLLGHLKNEWDSTIGKAQGSPLADQTVVITVPASFDESAQRLTLEAAELVGFPNSTTLLEEPQAAFFAWIEQVAQSKSGTKNHFSAMQDGARILVCDVGGGTTDFSLFHVNLNESRANFERIKVSDHLLLGGDNIDMTIANLLEPMLAGHNQSLSSQQWHKLVFECQKLKEIALGNAFGCDKNLSEASHKVVIPGDASNLFESTLSTEISLQKIQMLVMKEFFEKKQKHRTSNSMTSALSDWGLPYEENTSIIDHLLEFVGAETVDYILFNGGSLKPMPIQRSIQNRVAKNQKKPASILVNRDMDLNVAHGAAYFGFTKSQKFKPSQARFEGASLSVKAGYPRNVFLLINKKGESKNHLFCLVSKGATTSSMILEPEGLNLLVGSPVKFQICTSLQGENYRSGFFYPEASEEKLLPLPPLQTNLAESSGRKSKPELVPIVLKVEILSTGLIQVSCIETAEPKREWALDFDLNAKFKKKSSKVDKQTKTDVSQEEAKLPLAKERVAVSFGKKPISTTGDKKPKGIFKDLEMIFNLPRQEWNYKTLRSLWPHLYQGITRRSRSIDHEASWLGLAGYCLRPGFGEEQDEYRLSQLLELINLGLAYPKEKAVEIQWWILWRRVSGGLDAKTQHKLVQKILPRLRNNIESLPSEAVMCAASFERLTLETRTEIARAITKHLAKRRLKGSNHYIWALKRILSRTNIYSHAGSVVPPNMVISAYQDLLPAGGQSQLAVSEKERFKAIFLSASRLTLSRHTDLPQGARDKIQSTLKSMGASDFELKILSEYRPLSRAETSDLFGESLPNGLELLS